jgi:hypothetical protein
MEKKQKRNSKDTNQNLNVCYFCKKPIINNDWCYIEKEGLKTKAHFKCVAIHQF